MGEQLTKIATLDGLGLFELTSTLERFSCS